MRLRVREAKPRDLGLFKKLWVQFMENQQAYDADVGVTERNIELYCNMFDHFVNNPEDGIVLFIGENAVLMWGSAGDSPFETNCGRTATAWGVFVEDKLRGKGAGDLLRQHAKKVLYDRGFDTVLGCVLKDNIHGYNSNKDSGFREIGVMIRMDLSEDD